jgi:DNA (cytosine-5)-methyltransferase 1
MSSPVGTTSRVARPRVPSTSIAARRGMLRRVTRKWVLRQGLNHLSNRCIGALVLPDANHLPACVAKHAIGIAVPRHVAGQLLRPPLTVVARARRVLGTTVPEATVDEDRHVARSEGQVGSPTRQAWQRVIDSIAVSQVMQSTSQFEFRFGVAPRLSRHPHRRLRSRREHRPGPPRLHSPSPSTFSRAPYRPVLRRIQPLMLLPRCGDDAEVVVVRAVTAPATRRCCPALSAYPPILRAMTPGRQGLPLNVHMVDLFAGPGGLDVAAQWLGISSHGIEWDDDACATRDKAGLTTTPGDVREVRRKGFNRPSDLPTILAGGPPCQTYTVAGNGIGRRSLKHVVSVAERMASGEDVQQVVANLDERTGLVLEPLRWALEAKESEHPYDAIVLEQVPTVLPVWQAVGAALEKLGYNVECKVLHTEEYGVPQTRKRAILIARLEQEATMPSPTHRRYWRGESRGEGSRPWETMAAALDRREPFRVISNYGTGGDPKKRGERTSDQPSATVTGKISRNRVKMRSGADDRFSFFEAGRLQTFPHDYPWAGHNVAQQIGNAIPPRLAVHVLASALGRRVDEASLDDAVTRSWKDAHGTTPLVKTELLESDRLPVI